MREEHLATRASVREPLGRKLRRHGPTIAFLGAVLAWGGWWLGAVWSDPPVEALVAEVGERRAALEHQVATRAFPVEEERAGLEALVAQLAPVARPAALKPPGETLVAPTAFLEARRGGKANEIVFLPPRDVVAEGQPGGIELRWVADADGNVPADGWVVSRQSGAGTWEEVVRLPAATTRWVDRSTKPGIVCRYRLAAFTKDAALLRLGETTSPPSEIVENQAETETVVELLAVLEDGRARLRIRKLGEGEPAPETLVEVAEGDVVGGPDAGSRVDFTTGWTVRTITREQKRREREREVPLFDPTGRVRTTEVGTPITERVRVFESYVLEEVLLVTDSGRERRLSPARKR